MCDDIITQFAFTDVADQIVKEYSGGTKRKLSVALTLCFSPRAVFLDEPSSGLDPVSRRRLWKIIEKVKREDNTAFLLTTHSLEEADALCNRIGIIVKGSIRCLGSPQHLKSRFGGGKRTLWLSFFFSLILTLSLSFLML